MRQTSLLSVVTCLLIASALRAQDDGIIIRKDQRTLAQIEQIYSQIPPVVYTPPPGRFENLRRTRKLLTAGDEMKVVMLGDSIVNDASRSCWNLWLQKRFPECRIHKVTSVRGSTGCWWYKQAPRVRRFVLDHDPDLVIVGGISHRNDVDSIRRVIRQIRAESRADILLMTGAFGNVDPMDQTQWRRISDPNHHTPYRRDLERLARAERTAFLDMEAAWAAYIRTCGRDLEWFKRDPIHANERGEQILGRILLEYLTPPKPRNAPPARR